MTALILALLAGSPAVGAASPTPSGSQTWEFLDERPAKKPVAAPAPSSVRRREALDDLQGALGQWQKERRDFSREVSALEEIKARRNARSDDTVAAEPQPNRPGQSGPKGRGKVIEVAPDEVEGADAASAADDEQADAAESMPLGDTPVEQEMRRLEAELEDRKRRCQEDAASCEEERARRRVVREGNRAWDEAIEKKRRAREEAIEAEARRIQAEVDAARRREAQQRARELGGTINERGDFVDRDLDAEIAADKEKADD